MTREEEFKLYLKERNIPINSLEANSIIEGIEWADSHPKLSEEEQVGMGGLGMMWQKKHLIDKACGWLKEEFYTTEDRDGYPVVVSSSCNNVDDLIEDFRKTMEE